MAPVALQARYLLPIDGPPIENGVITIDQGTIVAIGQKASTANVKDLGNVAIMPGLVNAHTHLEFSDLAKPLGEPGSPLPEWIGTVIQHRRSHERSREEISEVISQGLAEAKQTGTTLIGEIATADVDLQCWTKNQPRGVAFREAIGLSADRSEDCLANAKGHLHTLSNAPAELFAGLSPHAPYTVHPDLVSSLVQLSSDYQVPLAMHLAESREELQLLRDGTGPFRELLEQVNAWDEGAIPLGTCPLDYLKRLAMGCRVLVIHGNYLDEEEIDFIAANASQMSVIYCPRTHAFFQHEPYPLQAMLNAGVLVGLGTDSRASNPDLSLLAEMRHVAGQFEISAADILRMGTINGAIALGWGHKLGTLTIGKAADLVTIQLPKGEIEDVSEEIVRGTHCGAGAPPAL